MNHEFLVIAYVAVLALQLGYLLRVVLGLRSTSK